MKISTRLPYATLLIIAINIAAAFLLLFRPELVNTYGFQPANPTALAAFTCLFLHLNVLHLLGNMVFLAAVGPAVEMGVGTLRFLLCYFLGGFAGVVAHWTFAHRAADAPVLVGASGCIAAIIAYYALRYHRARVNIAPNVTLKVTWLILTWVALQVLGAFVHMNSIESGTSYWSHIGGFAMGLILSVTFRAPQQAHKEIVRQTIDKMDTRSPAAKLAAINMVLRGDPRDTSALRGKADTLDVLGEIDEEAATLRQLLDLTQDADQIEILAKLNKINRIETIPSLRRTLLADRYKNSSPDVSRMLLISVIRVMSDNQRPEALFALACLDHEAHPENAKTWLKDLFTNYPLHPASDLARARGWSP